MPKVMIKVDNVSKSFGSHQVLKDISFEVKEGEIYGLIGMSGSGKSTLLNVISDLISPDEGDVLFNLNGKFLRIFEHPFEVKRFFGYSFQQPSFHPMLTVKENVEHFASLYGIPRKFAIENTEALLNLVELSEAKNTLGKDLSGGMQRRLCFACSLVHSPKVLFLDEPTSNLDPVLRREIWNLLKKINSRGTTIVITSQILSEIELFCNNICIINNGRIAKEGSMLDIKKGICANSEIILESIPGKYSDVLEEIKKSKLKITSSSIESGRLLIYAPNGEKVLHLILHFLEKGDEELIDITLNKPTLSEVFESVVNKK